MNQINCDVFIPVRLDSSRLPKKHLQPLNGKPALQHLLAVSYTHLRAHET